MDNVQIDPGHLPQRKRASVVVLDPSPVSLLALAGVLDSQGYSCVCARDPKAAEQALQQAQQDLLVCDVADDAPAALELLEKLRTKTNYEQLPAVLIADARWAGLEKKAEAMSQATRCLFKPIDPNSLIAVVDQLLWMPSLVSGHRRRSRFKNQRDSLRPWMGFLVYFPQLLNRHVRVNLGRRQACVPEQLLHASQVGTGIEQVRRKRMPEGMRRLRRVQSGRREVFFHQPFDRPRREAPPIQVAEDGVTVPPAFLRPQHIGLVNDLA